MRPQPRPSLKCWKKAAKYDQFQTREESGIITHAYGFSLIKRFWTKICHHNPCSRFQIERRKTFLSWYILLGYVVGRAATNQSGGRHAEVSK